MITKYDVGQTVLIKAKVEQILIADEGKTYYGIVIKTNDSFYTVDKSISVNADEIVCGWIGGNECQ